MDENITSILNNKKVTITAVRELVLKIFVKNQYALSLADIENELPWSDRVTLFRTLKTFEQKGVIHQINDGTASVKYALCLTECKASEHLDIHPHFHCENCSKTICLEKQEINIANIPNDIIINSYSLVVKGLCSDCLRDD
jgi:Fur family ferric uptake transcriptional regulator